MIHYLQVSRKTVYNLRIERGLPCKKLGGAVRFDPQEVKDYLKKDSNLNRHRNRRSTKKPRDEDKPPGTDETPSTDKPAGTDRGISQ